MSSIPLRKLRYAMVGGGRDAFIGAVHRKAMALDGQYEQVAGALSSTADKARASGQELGLAPDRNHASWQDLLADALRRSPADRIDVVSSVAPNHITERNPRNRSSRAPEATPSTRRQRAIPPPTRNAMPRSTSASNADRISARSW